MKRSSLFPEESYVDLYLNEIAKYRPLKSEEEAQLALNIKKGDRKALNKLVQSNLRFVVSVARKYEHQGMLLSDLINEGNLGLIRAAQRFDETKNFRFISYAVWWIRQAILQALANHSRPVKLPNNVVGKIHTVSKTEERLKQRLGRDVSTEEISAETGRKTKQVRETMRAGSKPLSLDSPVLENSGQTFVDTLVAEESAQPDVPAEQDSFKKYVNETLSILDPKEHLVVTLYFGLGRTGQPQTLDEIGARLKVTRERVRQIKGRALEKLRENLPGKLADIILE
ncbi:MAG: sigma-70 family RNA polymerase sigma factor [Chitinivibrionales bacterium]|nr:sigma-70 family RNA polymerase sigma factor [Chitinivibrionales bacterium]